MHPGIFQAKIESIEARFTPRDCCVLIYLVTTPPDAWIREFMRYHRSDPSYPQAKIAIRENIITIRVPKLRRTPINNTQIETAFKSALNKIRRIEQRFLVFEQEPVAHTKEIGVSNEAVQQTNLPLAEIIQKQLGSILLAWENEPDHYFEV